MALTTYTELLAEIADYVDRTDLTAVIPDFVLGAESMFNYGDRERDFNPIRHRLMETTQTSTPSSGDITLQTDFLAMRRVTYAASLRKKLEYVSPEAIDEMYPSTTSSDPQVYTIIGSTLTIRPVGSSDVEYVYLQKIPDLATNSTNWLLSAVPTAYLFASLFQLHVYDQNPEAATGFLQLARSAVGGLNESDKFSRAGSYAMRSAMPAW